MKPQKLAEIFKAGRLAAENVNQDDSGNDHNLDTPAVHLGMSDANVQAAAKEAGVSATSFEWFGKKYYWIADFLEGSASRRTRMAEAFHCVMIEHGLDAKVYYHMRLGERTVVMALPER